MRVFYVFYLLAVSFILLLSGGCSTQANIVSRNQKSPGLSNIERDLGIKIEAIRLSAGGYMLDFRYWILDPEKAKIMQDVKIKPYLVDEATGAKFIVPTPPKVGSLRQIVKAGAPKAGKRYFMIFANPAQFVKAGSRVSVVMGDITIKGLTVQ